MGTVGAAGGHGTKQGAVPSDAQEEAIITPVLTHLMRRTARDIIGSHNVLAKAAARFTAMAMRCAFPGPESASFEFPLF